MNASKPALKIAIVGGGPAGLFLYKQFVETLSENYVVHIFEAGTELGRGLPYSHKGADKEHITNVSGNEIPELVTPILEWMKNLPVEMVSKYGIDIKRFSDYKVFPRLLFGEYLNSQFNLLLEKSEKAGIETVLHLGCTVTNITDAPARKKIQIALAGKDILEFDHVVVCTGHKWPLTHEKKIAGFFDSPYPPAKLSMQLNHEVALKGSSLTAIDAIRTLARQHGRFTWTSAGKLSFIPNQEADRFKIIMYSLNGLLPGVRFHLDDPHLSNDGLLTDAEIADHMKSNGGFLSLDFIFDKDFKALLKEKDPTYYAHIKDMRMEEFVDELMSKRERTDPFVLFKQEYDEANKSIRKRESVHWKELLAVLSFAMNYPAKHLSAEDMLRLKKVLMPLISIVIAFVPQSSCEELIAMHDAGRLDLIAVGPNSYIEVNDQEEIVYHHTDEAGIPHAKVYKTYINCTGQPHLSLKQFPFSGLVKDGVLTPAQLAFRSTESAVASIKSGNDDIQQKEEGFYLTVPGVTINDSFRAVDKYGHSNPRVYIMAVPYIGGYNPDYSGLDFCEEAAGRITRDICGQAAAH
ncbi:MAG: FAD/NAD(P)-binding protein [Chitinophagaceae bacterium]